MDNYDYYMDVNKVDINLDIEVEKMIMMIIHLDIVV